MVCQAQGQVVGHIGPARPHIHARQLQPRQERDGVDLVLRVFLDHAPDLLVVQRQHLGVAVLLQQKQRLVPPVVRDHEGVQPRPGVTHAGHEVDAFRNAALGQHHMGQRVVGPRLFAAPVDGVVGGSFGFFEPVALFPAKGQHAVQVGHIGGGVLRLQGQPQHGGRVAAVEAVVLPELERGQVARVQSGLFFVQGDGAGQVAIDPRGHSSHKALLAFAGLVRVGQGLFDEGPGVAGCVGRFGKHVQRRAIGLHQRAGIGLRLQHIHGPGFAGDEALHKVVDGRKAAFIPQRDGVAQAVGEGCGHAATGGALAP